MCIVSLHTSSYSYTLYNCSAQNKEQKALGQLLNSVATQNYLHTFYDYVDRIVLHLYNVNWVKMADEVKS